MNATREALEQSVKVAWANQGISPANTATRDRLASVAVADMIEALRYNPAWRRSLGMDAS